MYNSSIGAFQLLNLSGCLKKEFVWEGRGVLKLACFLLLDKGLKIFQQNNARVSINNSM